MKDSQYADLVLLSVLARLVTCVYSRDMQNCSAVDGVEEFWELMPYENHNTAQHKKVLEELGLAFFLRRDPHPNPTAPRLVIAIRGTIPSRMNDIAADLHIGHEVLAQTDRFISSQALIVKVIKEFKRTLGGSDDQICMAGHSLGAAIALLVGWSLVSNHGIRIDTHLYNCPSLRALDVLRPRILPYQSVLPTEEHQRASLGHKFFTALGDEFLKVFGSPDLKQEWEEFQKLHDWTPHFYLNSYDVICNRYIKYYTKRHGQMVQMPNMLSSQGIISRQLVVTHRILGMKAKYFGCVVPSAELYISYDFKGNLIQAHELKQWVLFKGMDVCARLHKFSARLLAHIDGGDGHCDVKRIAGKVGLEVHDVVGKAAHNVHDVVGNVGHGVHHVVGHIVGDSSVHQAVGRLGHDVHTFVGGLGHEVHKKIGKKLLKKFTS